MERLNSIQQFPDPMRKFLEKSKIGPREYKEYIKSFEWKTKSEYIKQDRGYRCQLCNISGYVASLHVHHNTYERLGDEREIDVVVLCADCHELFHKYKKPQANNIPISDDEIRKVLHYNGVSPKNEDPWNFYSIGKMIIQHIVDGFNAKLFDSYNKINIDIVYNAIDRQYKQYEENEEE
jgi:hypothetical protein